ncbi:MAG: DUF4397 domain-containing protein [Planctomycetota bacterium]
MNIRQSFFTIAAGLSLAGAMLAQDARLSVLHGVPGLPSPVDVVANGGTLFSFDYLDKRGPLNLPAGTYNVEVRLAGNPILSANLNLASGTSYTAIAHLDAVGTPRLSLFTNNETALALPKSRLTVRHTAQAPAVDVVLEQNGQRVATIPNLTNPNEAVADVAPGIYAASLFVAGTNTRAFGPVSLAVEDGVSYGIHAVGDVSSPNFGLIVQRTVLTARVSVIHGVPGLPSPVDVFAGTSRLFSFDFGELRGPLVLNPGTYPLSVQLGGNPILSLSATVAAGDNVTVIAHLDAQGTPRLSAYANDVSPANGGARLTARHLAAAPPVDIGIDTRSQRVLTLSGVVNGQSATAPVGAGLYSAMIFDTTSSLSLGPIPLKTGVGVHLLVHAVGDLGAGTFRAVVQTIDLFDAVPGSVQSAVSGVSCGPQIGASPSSFDYGEEFAITVSGGGASASAILNLGDSNQSLGSLGLPFDLTALGAPGCFLSTNVWVSHPLTLDASGQSAVGFLIPRAAFGGLPDVYCQFFVLEPSANALGVTASNVLQLRAN